MEGKRILTISKEDGTREEVEEVISFRFEDTKKEYVVYTKNEVDENGNITIYVTELIKDETGNRFVGVTSDEEWAKIKDVLRELVKSN